MSDLASILISERIIYLGMALASDDETRQSFSSGMNVTQLMIAQLLCLEYEDDEAPITIYINSSGSTDINSNAIGHENEAFAIYDTMRYIKAPVNTFCVGMAMGTATMLLAAGQLGKRASLPNASIILNQPYNYVAGSSTEINIQVEQLLISRSIMHEILSIHIGKSLQQIRSDCNRIHHLTPYQAVQYGIIDSVIAGP
ncbi:MAG TPA: ATP-dependent Clp protease proteolytic subunit [Prochlorococcaceae cyanobacterium AMR_MDS_5431]|uniref:ATP-dependent Clp protease proteolytic subunit n=1 Tax=Paulinella micropora TaxID=1928728 RepID=A0A1L5YB27_9EUKA|nr:ATP-dependent Clp protease, proteolytic subunit ClpP [Paulinella micropora]HRD41455.1 ATP-dependent Clp protease proteolytic subunit [Prochlorococcaceae cyanobacterium AMR_MDS_5431]